MLKKIGKTVMRFREYFYDRSINIKNRAFLLFAVASLFSLLLAIPCGFIMGEPLVSTFASIAGFLFFTGYILITYKTNTLEQAKKIIALIMVFIYLPVMFFTNGGIYGGTPVWLILGTIYICMILEGTLKRVLLVLNPIVILSCCVIGYLKPELIIEFDTFENYVNTIAAFLIVSGLIYTLISFQIGIYNREEAQNEERSLFEQTATALIDALKHL